MSHSITKPNLNPQPRSLAMLPWLLCVLLIWPLSVSAAIERAAIASGGSFSCALLTDGSVQCWGSNSEGQLGDGTTISRPRPAAVQALTDVVQISAGGGHACAVLQNQRAKCWGSNDAGQLGDQATIKRSIPVSVQVEDGNDLTGVVEVAAGQAHTCARLVDGRVKCWGVIDYGSADSQNPDPTVSPIPGLVADLDGTELSKSATALVAGSFHTCAVRGDGVAVCWGRNNSGQLGNGTTNDQLNPVQVNDLIEVVELAAGEDHSCARLSSGAVKCWGAQALGRLGNGNGANATIASPVDVTNLDGVGAPRSATAITAGASGSCALMADQTLRCWGIGERTGDGSTHDALTPRKVLSSGSSQDSDTPLSDAVAVSLGGLHGCALVDDGGAFCWGVGSSGQLGNGEVRVWNDPALNPVPVLSSGTVGVDPVPFSVLVAAPMVLKFDTSKGDGKTIALSLRGTVDVVIDWGDGNTTTRQAAGIVSHEYTAEGEYEVRIAGSVTHFGQIATGSNNALAGAEMLVEVVSFGDLGVESLEAAFFRAENLTQVASDLPSTVTNLRSVFEEASRFNGDISDWQLENVTDLSRAFYGASAFNQPIGSWDVSNVTTFGSTFRGASQFNADLAGWNVSNATDFFGMFISASSFEGNGLSDWEFGTESDITMWAMFWNAAAFSEDLSSWNVSSVINMRRMFRGAGNFNADLSTWDVASVTDMESMFWGASSFKGKGLSEWDISSVVRPQSGTGLDGMLSNSGLTRQNYDALLIAWSSLSGVPSGLNLNAAPTQYTIGPAQRARQKLIDDLDWIIEDGGSVNVFAAGDGTEDDPFQIANWTHLDKVRNFPASHFILKNHLSNITPDYSDFVDSAEGWLPIGNPDAPFIGSLDGAELEIADLVISRSTEDNVGLFAAIDGATIQRLTLSRADVRGRGPVGALVGSVSGNSQVSRITMDGQVQQTGTESPFFHRGGGCLVGVAGGTAEIQDIQADCQIVVDGSWSADYTGGLIGWLIESASVENAHTTGTVVGQFRTGGLIGRMDDNSSVTHSSSSMSVTASDNSAGGLVGRMDDNAVVHRSFATGDVEGTDRVGGLIGDMDDAPVVQRSFATGNVSGGLRVGGLIGYMDDDSVVEQSFATGNVIGDRRVGGLIGEMDNESLIENVYATGNVTGDDRVGGLVGRLDDRDNQVINAWSSGTVTANTQFGGLIGEDRQGATIQNSFWDAQTSGLGASGDDNFGATGRTTAEMKLASSFTGWDFSSSGEWDIKARDSGFVSYPFLRGFDYDASPLSIPGLQSPFPGIQLAMVTEPVGGPSGALMSTSPVVEVLDIQGQRATEFATGITVSLADGPDGLLSPVSALTVTPEQGLAAFDALRLSGVVGEEYQLLFTADGTSSVASTTLSVTPGDPSQWVISAEDGSAIGGQLQNVPFDVRLILTDAFGNVTTATDPLTVTLGTEGGQVPGALRLVGSHDASVAVSLPAGTSTVVVAVLHTGLSTELGQDIRIIANAGVLSGQSNLFSVRDTELKMTIAETSLEADGQATTLVTVRLSDAQDDPVAGQTILLSTTRGLLISGSSELSELSLMTNNNGEVSATLRAPSTPGTATVTAACAGACTVTQTVIFTEATPPEDEIFSDSFKRRAVQ